MLIYSQQMKKNNQQMRKINQQKSGQDRSPSSDPKGDPDEDRGELRGSLDRWNFLDRFSPLFRKSSLMLIATLGRNYTSRFHVRDLSRVLHYDVSLVSKNLKQLEMLGLVTHEEVGNLVLYRAHMESVLVRQVKICFTLMELNEMIRAISPLSTNAILFGSCAKGEDTATSDIDLFIETREKEEVHRILDDIQPALPRTLSPVVVTPDETYTMKREDLPFYSSIQQGIVIHEATYVV